MADKRQDRIFKNISKVDISEQDIWDYHPDILRMLLIDHTMSAEARAKADDHTKVVNIFWATNDYESSIFDSDGQVITEGYCYNDEIKAEKITGLFSRIIMPRVLKDKQAQIERTKNKAEVFTPSWVCNAQNNLIDDAWFGYSEAFNKEIVTEEGVHSWITKEEKIQFLDPKKNWKKYIKDNRLEITCGEAPYLVSRYDTTTGEPIPIKERIGLLDRKMRVVNENVETEAEWYKMAEKAIKSTYGYEWQGDNLLLAREALLYTYIEYFIDKFNEKDAEGKYITDENGNLNVPTKNKILNAAYWISWNIWQMDGIKMVVPDSCEKVYSNNLLGEQTKTVCPACQKGDKNGHIGITCYIRDWNLKKPADWEPKKGEDPHSQPWQKIKFITLITTYQQETIDDDIDND